MASDPVPVSWINEPLPPDNVSALVRPKQRSLHASLAETLASSRGLLTRLENGNVQAHLVRRGWRCCRGAWNCRWSERPNVTAFAIARDALAARQVQIAEQTRALAFDDGD